jgi:hypothetical protein
MVAKRTKENGIALSESQKRLLSSYLDGCAGFFGRYRAERLIDSSEDAQRYCEEAAMVTQAVRNCCKSEAADCSAIWQKVAARIEAEERAEKYLGSREDVKSWFGWYERFAWSFAGAGAVAALMMLTFNIKLSNNATRLAKNVATSVSAPFSSANTEQVAFIPEGSQVARELKDMELDWVRSDGTWRLRQMPPEEGNSIIWVRRKSLSMARGNSAASNSFAQQQSRIPQGVPVSIQR